MVKYGGTIRENGVLEEIEIDQRFPNSDPRNT